MTTLLHTPSLLTPATTLDAHHRTHGRLPDLDARDIRALTAAAGLTGHGGAGFPTHRKLDAVASGTPTAVIANGADSEPASDKDRTLLARAPHLVLDGLALATRAVGADESHIYLTAASAPGIRTALAERTDQYVTVHIAPDMFVAGEESAVVAAVAGRSAIPADKRVRITERGLHGRPTLVQNVETLAHLALIARNGPTWYRSHGTTAEPGTFLATVTGPVRRPGVYDVPYGISLGDLLATAGHPTRPLQAVLVGGYHGAWIPADDTIPISRAGLAPYGGSPGAGIVVALSADACGLTSTAHMVSYLARQTTGQCGPCVNGLPRIADTFAALARRTPRPNLVADLDRLSRLVAGRGACKHPDGTARLVRSALHMFARECAAHLGGWCTATEGAR
jgi:NADH:ubiquinone oxidoreductase subunit F (NADH-binding)